MSGPKYTYTSNVPQSSQSISATQKPILNNFQAINELISVNHINFNDPDDYGKHNYTSLPEQGSDPSTLSGEMALYCKATPTGPNDAELYYRYPSNGTVVQLTGGTGGGTAATNGYAYMSDTVFIMWGTATGIVTGSNVITLPTGGSFPTLSAAPYQIYFTAATNYSNVSAGAYLASSTTTTFTVQVPGSNYATSIYWLLIGA